MLKDLFGQIVFSKCSDKIMSNFLKKTIILNLFYEGIFVFLFLYFCGEIGIKHALYGGVAFVTFKEAFRVVVLFVFEQFEKIRDKNK